MELISKSVDDRYQIEVSSTGGDGEEVLVELIDCTGEKPHGDCSEDIVWNGVFTPEELACRFIPPKVESEIEATPNT